MSKKVLIIIGYGIGLLCVLLLATAFGTWLFFGQIVRLHFLFMVILALFFLKEWKPALWYYGAGVLCLTYMNDLSPIPLTVAYGLGVIVFLFFSEFLFKTRAGLAFGINVSAAGTVMLASQILISHLLLFPERAAFSVADGYALLANSLVNGIVFLCLVPFIFFLSRRINVYDVYGR